ncbi:hypothetical protein DPMN_096384 [Dreissena polymorpha]|uniref:Uncharacterized protein n=1 Tax=Dreissena polymorpha TaxID=45954 RepID=A0A9D4L9S3_DREPO|nr:hypothetical protein DPMN_096384 [Dreissena polymorpha]
MRAGQHLKKGCGTLKNISLEHLGNNVVFKQFLLQVWRVFGGLVSTDVVLGGGRFI